MITKLEIENFYSIQNRQILDLTVPGNALAKADHLTAKWPGSQERVPKVIAIFGANGSGKSNVLRALSFIASFVERSFLVQDSGNLPFMPYNDDEHSSQPTKLKLWVSGPESPTTNAADEGRWCDYCYELEISNGETQSVHHEVMYFWPSATGRRTRLVERFGNGAVRASKAFGLGPEKAVLKRILKPNSSVISTLAQLNHSFSKAIVQLAPMSQKFPAEVVMR